MNNLQAVIKLKKNNMDKVYILIPIHNNIAETIACLNSIRDQTYTSFEVIIIDDGSTDNSSEIIRKEFPETTILQGDGNLWWAGALFKGIEYAINKAEQTDYVLTLNNDLVFDNDYLKFLIEASKNNGDAIVGSLCLDKKTGAIVDSGVLIDWGKLRFDLKLISNENDDLIRSIDVLSTRGTLIPINVILNIGNFIPDKLRHYLSDYEYTIRAKKYGYTLLASKRAIAYLNMETTGFYYQPKEKYTLKDIYNSMFATKSYDNLKAWLNFIYLCCPARYKPICYTRIIGGKVKWIIKTVLHV